MIPHERSLVERMKDKPFALLGVNSDVDKGYIRSEAVDMGVSWRSFWCGDRGTSGLIPSKWNVRSWPTIYVIDHEGVIRFKNVRGDDMDAAVDALIGKMEAAKK
jgi:hypothetical protein